jgi:hypothetical protein
MKDVPRHADELAQPRVVGAAGAKEQSTGAVGRPVAHDDPTPDGIMQLGSGYWSPKTLLSAVELGLFTELASAGEFDADALCGRLGPPTHAGARDFFDALVALRMLECASRTLARRRPKRASGLTR